MFAVGGDSDSVTPISAVTSGAAGLRSRPAYPGRILAGGRGHLRVGRDGVRREHDLRHPHAHQRRLGTAGAADPASASYGYPTAIELAPSGSTAVVVDTYSGQVTLVSTGSRRVLSAITVGSNPVAVAIAR